MNSVHFLKATLLHDMSTVVCLIQIKVDQSQSLCQYKTAVHTTGSEVRGLYMILMC